MLVRDGPGRWKGQKTRMLTNIYLGAKVESPDGDNLGDLKYLVADPKSDQVTHLVVDRSGIDARQIVVEVTHVQDLSTDGKVVTLDLSDSQLYGMPDFMDREYVNVGTPYSNPTEADTPVTDVATPSGEVYGAGPGVTATAGYLYPISDAGLGGPGAAGLDLVEPNSAAGGQAFAPVYSDLDNPVGIPYEEKLNVPQGSLIIREGADVMAQDGKVGQVKRVNLDPNSSRIVSFTVEKGFIFTEDVTIPVEMVESATTEEINLNVTKDAAKNASAYNPTDPGNYQRDRL